MDDPGTATGGAGNDERNVRIAVGGAAGDDVARAIVLGTMGAGQGVGAVGEERTEVRGATMYVTLEPHDHRSTQPPCSLAVIDAGIARVVVGALDPNVETHGNGVARMRAEKSLGAKPGAAPPGFAAFVCVKDGWTVKATGRPCSSPSLAT